MSKRPRTDVRLQRTCAATEEVAEEEVVEEEATAHAAALLSTDAGTEAAAEIAEEDPVLATGRLSQSHENMYIVSNL